jgi:hypothetical protein
MKNVEIEIYPDTEIKSHNSLTESRDLLHNQISASSRGIITSFPARTNPKRSSHICIYLRGGGLNPGGAPPGGGWNPGGAKPGPPGNPPGGGGRLPGNPGGAI